MLNQHTFDQTAVSPVHCSDDDGLQAWLDRMSYETTLGSFGAEQDEYWNFKDLADGADAADIEGKISDNLKFMAEHDKLVTPDAEPMGHTHDQTYRETYRRLRRERLANGGVLPTDPDQRHRGHHNFGGPLTDREVALRVAALGASRAH